MDLAVAACISTNDVTFGVDSVCFGKQGSRNVNRLEVALAQQKSMHVSVRIEIEPEDLALRIDAGYPSKSGTRKIDGREIAPVQQKTRPLVLDIAETVITYDVAPPADHGNVRF